jgi:hypothetical protein
MKRAQNDYNLILREFWFRSKVRRDVKRRATNQIAMITHRCALDERRIRIFPYLLCRLAQWPDLQPPALDAES